MELSPDVDNPVGSLPSQPSIWETLKDIFKARVSSVNYNNWFKPIQRAQVDGGHLIIHVPNRFIADWITDYYVDLIEKEAQNLLNRELKVRFQVVAEEDPKRKIAHNGHNVGEMRKPPDTAVSEPVFVPPTTPVLRLPRIHPSVPLNPKYTFDNFVIGPGNQLAHAAAKAVAEFPGGHYNPLFLYGGVGLGKTHLLNAIGIEILKKYPDLKIIYLSSEKFMNEFINSVRHDRMNDFRRKYRENCDLFLVDDIQFLGGKESTQDEFFHTFNALYDAHRQIILTSDKVPKEIPGLEERLRSRFEWGLIADIQPPDLETRYAILRKKGEKDGIRMTDEVAMFLAKEIRSNVRELEGSLIRLNAFARLKNMPITLDLAKEVLRTILPNREDAPAATACNVERVQKVVAEYYRVRMEDLCSGNRRRSFAHPRQVAMYLCKKHLKISFPELGSKFGGKDHTTVMHACRKIERCLQEDGELRSDLDILEKTLLH